MSFDELYRDVILDHHQHPRGAAPLETSNARSAGMNPTCGDDVTVTMNIRSGHIEDIQVVSHGCAICTAAGSMFAERAKGITLEELKRLTSFMGNLLKTGAVPAEADLGDLEALAGVSRFPVRVKCAMLPLATAKQAVDAFEAEGRDAPTITTE